MYGKGEQLALTAHRDVPEISFVRNFINRLRNNVIYKNEFDGAGCSIKMY